MRIIAKTFKVPSGVTVKQYFNTVEEQVASFFRNGNEVPRITIKPKEAPKITIKPKEPLHNTPARKDSVQVSGADILAEQNKAMVRQSNSSHRFTVKRVSEANPLYIEIDRLMNNGPMNLEKAQKLEKLFFENTVLTEKGYTGINLYCPSNSVEGAFSSSLTRIIEAVKGGTFPKEIKHVLIGHGIGSSLTPRGWQMSGISVNDGKIIEIYDFLNKLKLPKKEPVLVLCCEDGIKSVPGKPGVGMQVDLGLSNLGGFDPRSNALMGPGKIVRSGENEICGHYTLIDKNVGGGLVYYD